MTKTYIKKYFSQDGILKKSLPLFEFRQEQLTMAEHVYDAFLYKKLLIAEAQTGTGKTLAYLIPAILSGQKTVISTGTKNLQEQVFKKEVPFLQNEVGLPFKAAYMKGRANYICLKKYKYFTKQGTFEFKSDIEHFSKVTKWINQTQTGDIEELIDIPENASFFKQITSSSEQCSSQKCPNFKECFITKMKERALGADIIIINHHLFFADLAVKESSDTFVVPHYQAIIFDEAHQLEETASSYFGITTSNYKIEELARDTRFAMSTEKIVDKKLSDILDEFVNIGTNFFNLFKDFSNSNEGSFKLSNAFKYKGDTIKKAMDKLLSSYDILVSHIELIREKKDDLQNCLRRAGTMKDELKFILSQWLDGKSDENYVYWCELRRKGIFLKATPIDVSAILKEKIFSQNETIILTSATLAADNSFTYIKEQLGILTSDAKNMEGKIPSPLRGEGQGEGDSGDAIKPDELILPSPFDFKNNSLYYFPPIKSEPSDPNFVNESAEHILNLILACKGRTFALFTSNKNMTAVYDLISGKIPYRTFIQGEMPKSAILKEFIADKSSVLFATMSFWEGVDVQGDALICVIIDKLPFASPGDPLMEARINLIKKKGGNPFFDFQVPQAVITLKQGLGRLIRKKDDYGILSILDKRLYSKGYGKKFIANIPKAKVSKNIKEVEEFLDKVEHN